MSEENQLSDSDEELQEHLAEVQTLLARHKLVEDLVQRQEGPRHDLVEDLVHKQHLNELQRRLEPMHPADVAYILEALPLDERLIVWDLVKAERDGEILLEVSDAVRETLIESMERTELVAAAEREECAKLCGAYWESLEEIGEDDYQTGRARAAVDLQNAITARSQPTKGKDQK